MKRLRRPLGIAVLALALVAPGGAPAAERELPLGARDGSVTGDDQAKKRKRKFRRFFNFPTIGDGCGSVGGAAPQLRYFAEDRIEGPPDADAGVSVGNTAFAVCVFGFAAGEPVTVRFLWPDGTTTEGTDTVVDTGLDTLGVVGFDPLPGVPLGRYEVTAQQGTTVATGSVTVQRPTHPWLGIAAGSHRIGDSLRLVLAGFQADRRVRVAVYRESRTGRCPGQRGGVEAAVPFCLTDRRLRYRVDAQGDAIVPVKLRAGAYREGTSYLFVARAARMVASDPVFICRRGARSRYCLE